MNIFDLTDKQKEIKELVGKITDHVNSFTRDPEDFNILMSLEHRTLQQSFTRLCLEWLEHVAAEGYRTDGRNEGSHKVSKEMIEAFQKGRPEFPNTLPSQWLRYI